MNHDEAERVRNRIIRDHQAIIRRQPDAFLVEMLPTPADPDQTTCVQLTYLPAAQTLVRVYSEQVYLDLRDALEQYRQAQRRAGLDPAAFARRYPYLSHVSGEESC